MVKVDMLVMADSASVVNGKLYMLGAGWDRLAIPALPANFGLVAVACRFVVLWNDTNERFGFSLDIKDADGVSIFPEGQNGPMGELVAGRHPLQAPGTSQGLPLAFNLLGLRFQRYGTYATVVSVGGEERCRTTFEVVPVVGN